MNNLPFTISMSVDDLWKRKLLLAEPGKYHRAILMYKAVYSFVSDLNNGIKYNKKNYQETDYFKYLKHTYKARHNQSKILKRKLRKVKDLIGLYNDIKKNGIQDPLVAYEGGKTGMILVKGSRRLVIAKILGIDRVQVTIYPRNPLIE